MRWLADENVPMPSVHRLRSAGYDVMSVVEQAPTIPDTAVLAWAVREGRGLITLDRDYGQLIFQRGETPCVCVLYLRTAEFSPTAVADRILQFMSLSPALDGGYFTLTDTSVRRRDIRVH